MAILNIDRNPYPAPISVKLSEGKDLVNGQVIEYLAPKDMLNQELYEGKVAKAKAKKVAFIAEPFHQYDKKEVEGDMKFSPNDVVRAFPLTHGIVITVSKADCCTGSLALNDAVCVDNGKFKKDSDGSATVGYVTRLYTIAGQESVRIEFI